MHDIDQTHPSVADAEKDWRYISNLFNTFMACTVIALLGMWETIGCLCWRVAYTKFREIPSVFSNLICQRKARATLETGCPHTVLSQEHGQGETPQGKTVLSCYQRTLESR